MDLERYQKHYSKEGFLAKVSGAAKKAGKSVLYYAYLLFYMITSRQVPIKFKGIICGALGYFILPADIIPDFLVGLGFTDDLAVLIMAYKAIKAAVTPEIKQRARERAERGN